MAGSYLLDFPGRSQEGQIDEPPRPDRTDTLTSDVWVLVYRYLPIKCALGARLVCSSWRDISDRSCRIFRPGYSSLERVYKHRDQAEAVFACQTFFGNLANLVKEKKIDLSKLEEPLFPRLKRFVGSTLMSHHRKEAFPVDLRQVFSRGLEEFELRLSGCPYPEVLVQLPHFNHISTLKLIGWSHSTSRRNPSFPANLFGLIREIRTLEWVDFTCLSIADKDLEPTISKLDPDVECLNLKTLILWENDLTTPGVQSLVKLPAVEVIGVRFCNKVDVVESRAAFRRAGKATNIEAGISMSEQYLNFSQALSRCLSGFNH